VLAALTSRRSLVQIQPGLLTSTPVAKRPRHLPDVEASAGSSPAVRDNQRLLVDDPELATARRDRAKGLLVEEWFGSKAVGLNERFRFYRYDPGQRFTPHMDGCFQRDNGQQSQFTFLVYLNDGFEGGATAFHESRASLVMTPERGKALVFYHRQVHEGMPVVRGRKYVLRTDVMYRPEAR
jgi:predicted 2-oxoglutarate/Fe(II)-dependent dioxygenase YbiX